MDKMSPDQKIDLFNHQVLLAIDKCAIIENERPDLIVKAEGTMKVIDHKVAAVGEMLQANNHPAARLVLDRAVRAIELLNTELDSLIATSR